MNMMTTAAAQETARLPGMPAASERRLASSETLSAAFAERRSGRGRGRGRGRSRASGRSGRSGKATGDWSCANCGNYNYKFRDACNKCGATRSGEVNCTESQHSTGMDSSERMVIAQSGKAKQQGASAGGSEVKKTIAKGRGRGKGPRQRVKQLTQKIIVFAKRRRLADAQRVFQQLLDEGLTPALLTFSTFINAHVASGDMIGAERVFEKMHSAGIKPNSVIYNTLFKGYCVAGNTARTAALFEEMSEQDVPVIPDTNTVNAHLSCCLRAGDVGDAHDIFNKMTKDWAAKPDFFTYKREIQLLSRGLRLDALAEIHEQLRGLCEDAIYSASGSSTGAPSAALVWLHLHRGLSAALLGQWQLAATALQQVEAAGAAAAVAPEVHLVHSNAEQAPAAEGRGQHEFHQQVFRDEMNRLRNFLQSQEVLSDTTELDKIPAPDLRSALCRTFIFGRHTNAQARKQQVQVTTANKLSTSTSEHDEIKNGGELAVGLVRSLEHTFGLDVCVGRGLFTVRNMENRMRRRLQDEYLNWRKLFKPKRTLEEVRAGGAVGGADLPMKLEICSGFGEWVVAQAKAEAGVANWAALELRYDRCHNIFSRMVFEAIHNLCILGGDAAQILPSHIPPNSVDHVFVNFPEPPQTNMQYGAESHLHLLTADFFKQIHRVLRPGGRLTILHDEYRYCCLLARTVATLNSCSNDLSPSGVDKHGATGDGPGLYKAVLGLRGKGQSKHDCEDVEGIRLYKGVPGKKSGHVVRSSSYFDQLWERNKGKNRYFLVLSKC